jgi:hypothetical protein
MVRYGMGTGDGDNVFYWSTIRGVWYTGMDLRAFPFDRQELLVQMEVPQVSPPPPCARAPVAACGGSKPCTPLC